MGLIDKLFTQTDTQAEIAGCKSLIDAKAAAAKAEGKATAKRAAADANAAIVSNVTDNFIKVVEVAGNQSFTSYEDYLSGLEMFAESVAKVAKVASS